MTQVTLYGSDKSPFSAKVASVLEELNIPYKFVAKEFGDGPNGIKAPDFLKLNPFGKIPIIVDHTYSDKTVFDSNAIVQHLAETRGATDLLGRSPEERMEILSWMNAAMVDFGSLQTEYAYYKVLHPVKDLDPSVYERYIKQITVWCGILEKQLEKGDFIVLNRFTLADVVIFPIINLLPEPLFGINLEDYPRLIRYQEHVKTVPAVKSAYQKFRGPTSQDAWLKLRIHTVK